MFSLLVAACGSGGGGDSSNGDSIDIPSGDGSDSSGGDGSSGSSETTNLQVTLTDAPVDSAAAVCVTITGIELNPDDSGWTEYPFEITDLSVKCDEATDHVNLLTLTEGTSIELLDEDVGAGVYEVRLVLADDDGEGQFEHYIEPDTGGVEELFIPSGSQTGLKLDSSIVVAANSPASYTIDFDVRQSVVLRGNPTNNNGYLLQPVLRLIDNTEAGTISEVITDTTLLTTDCSDDDPLTFNIIYVFEGADATPDDYGSGGTEAVTTAVVNFDGESGEYSYVTAPLVAGEYTIALTCNGDLEDVDVNDELQFKAISNVTVEVDYLDNDDDIDEADEEDDEA
jgi:hypothetical protein